MALGTLTFVSLGLLLAGTLRAEAVLALANRLFLACLDAGRDHRADRRPPGVLQPFAAALPATALTDLLRIALDSGAELGVPRASANALVVLLVWGIGATAIASRTFRWDEG